MSFCFFLLLFCAGVSAADSTEIPAIEVKARRLRNPRSTSEISSQQLEPATGTTAPVETLMQSPSAMLHRAGNDRGETGVSIRGADPSASRFFFEGIPLTDSEFNGNNLQWIPGESVRALEIFPEGIPTTFASDGLGGAVNVRRRRYDEGASPPRGLLKTGAFAHRRLSIDTGTLGAPFQLGFEYLGAKDDFVFFDDNGTSSNTADDFWNRRDRNGFQRWSVLPSAVLLETPRTRLESLALAATERAEVPGPTYALSGGDLDRLFLLPALKLSHTVSPDLTWRGHAHCRYERSVLEGATGSSSTLPRETRIFHCGLQAGVAYQSGPFTFEPILGLNTDRLSLTSGGISAEYQKFHLPIGASGVWDLGDWSLRPAVISHAIFYEGAESVSSYTLSPRLGVHGRGKSPVRFRSTIAYFPRSPSLIERYGSPAGLSPNPSLEPERAWKAEVGADLETRLSARWKLVSGYTIFYHRSSELIALIPNSPTTRRATNIGEARILGNELGIAFEENGGWRVQILGVVHSTENLTSIGFQEGNELPGRPAYRLQTSLEWKPRRFFARLESNLQGPLFEDLANFRRLPATWEHNARTGCELRGAGTFSLEVLNLLDEMTATSQFGDAPILTSTGGLYGYPVPGRRWYVSWRYEL